MAANNQERCTTSSNGDSMHDRPSVESSETPRMVVALGSSLSGKGKSLEWALLDSAFEPSDL